MAALQDTGIKVFSGESAEEVEIKASEFLAGDSTVTNPRKILAAAPQLVIDGADFYMVISFVKAREIKE